MLSHSLSESFAGHKKPRTHLAPLQGTSYPLSPQEEPVSVLSPSPWALTARLTAPGCPSMFWAVLHVQLASGELPVKSLPAGTKVNFSHLMAHFSKDGSQKSSLPIWSQRLGAPHLQRGWELCPHPVCGCAGTSQCPRLHTRRFGAGTGTFSPSHVPRKSDFRLCYLSPALCQPPRHFCIFLRAAAR